MPDNPRIEELRRRVRKNSASIAFAELAEEYRRAGDFEEAANVCRAGLDRHPSYLAARVTLGRALIGLGQYDEARTELDYVLHSSPENVAAIRGLAEIHQRRGELRQALRQYQAALAIAKHDPDLEESVHDLMRQLNGATAQPTRGDAWSFETTPLPTRLDVPTIATDDQLTRLASRSARLAVTRARTFPALSAELEAAADEFTRALQALDGLSIDLRATSLPEVADPRSQVTTPPPAAPNLASAPMPLSEIRVLKELESWLDAVLLDRKGRTTRPTTTSKRSEGQSERP